MNVFGVAAEYNPFHSGHAFQLEQTRLAGATHTVAIMSGNFVQRGEPAIFSPRERTKAAILGGADLVIELPLPWAMARAQTFAHGVVAILDALGMAQGISFGSECGDVDLLGKTAQIISGNELSAEIKSVLASGVTFAAARQAAVQKICPECASVLQNPNDILATEYICAVNEIGASLKPLAIKREGAMHGDEQPHSDFASASAIRKMIASGADYSAYVPKGAGELYASCKPASISEIERAILYKMRTVTPTELEMVPDVSEGIENRIISAARQACSLDELYSLAKTKRYSHARIRRIVMSDFLGISAQDAESMPPYIRVLGFNSAGKEILAAAKKKAQLPIVMRTADVSVLGRRARRIYSLECSAADIRALCLKTIKPCGTAQTGGTIIL